MHDKVIQMEMSERFRSCPTCGYRGGFHSMFEKNEQVIKWLFICPSCHDTFDLGFTLENIVNQKA